MYFYNARWYDPALGRFTQPDTIVPDGVQGWDRYAYGYNNPLMYSDPDGHNPLLIIIAVALVTLKVIDYGWTAYDIYQSTNVINDPNASPEAKAEATANIVTAVAFEALEPDEALPVSLPLDDLARKGIISYGDDAADLVADVTKELTGQKHHVFSKKITDALAQHSTLSGIFKRNDIIVQATDKASHSGYQTWHRNCDEYIVDWLKKHPAASEKEFLEMLEEVYRRPDMIKRFPDGYNLFVMAKEEF